MRLIAFQYFQHEGTPREWGLHKLRLDTVNLIVGKNASGKSWTLNVIRKLASLLAAESRVDFSTGHFKATFQDGKATVEYELKIENLMVVQETLKNGQDLLLDRGHGGKGTIKAIELDRDMNFQTPENELAVVARRDSIQHPYLEALHQWGSRLYYYPFGTSLGKDTLTVFTADGPPTDVKNATQVVGIFRKGKKDFGQPFTQAIVNDLNNLGYDIEDISLAVPDLNVSGILLPGPLSSVTVQEKGIAQATQQHKMSQGMFRALSLIVQLNFGIMSSGASTIVIDDIGEGLDFERSCALIELLIEKVRGFDIQLIMSTNDRFVMNRVPIESWSILKRIQKGSRVYNYENSKEIFEDFKFTGLNNFDLLASDFLEDAENFNV
jgi:AAA domain, putative AbiEii toxin, Type IV TA system